MADLQVPAVGDQRTNLIVNYLPQTMSEKELYGMFITMGQIESCRIMKDNKTGYSYGFGFVNFTNPEDAAKAITTLNGLSVLHKRIKVSYARPPGEDIKEANLYISNLPKTITEEQLQTMFSPHGAIVQMHIVRDKMTSIPRGTAFVRYDKKEQAEAAIAALNGQTAPGAMLGMLVKIAEDHGRQKGSYYAGGYQTPANPGMAGVYGAGVPPGPAGRGGMGELGRNNYGAGRGSMGPGPMRIGKPDNRYNPMAAPAPTAGLGSYGWGW